MSLRKARRSGASRRIARRTTISLCGSPPRERRKDSRTMRRIWLRFTAERTNFFAMTTPSRADTAAFGLYNSSKYLPRSALRKAKTDENSSVLRSRCSPRKPRSTTAVGTSNAESGASLGPTGTNNCTAAARAHADKKTMGAFAPDYGWLVGAFHGCRLCKKRTHNYIF